MHVREGVEVHNIHCELKSYMLRRLGKLLIQWCCHLTINYSTIGA